MRTSATMPTGGGIKDEEAGAIGGRSDQKLLQKPKRNTGGDDEDNNAERKRGRPNDEHGDLAGAEGVAAPGPPPIL